MNNKFKSLFGALLLSIGGTAAASTINVDFGPANQTVFSGTGGSSDLGTVWNGLDFLGGTGLSDSFGLATSINVSTGASQGWTDTASTGFMRDRIFVSGSWDAFDVTLSGLDDSSLYNLYVYGSNTLFASSYTIGAVSSYSLGDSSGPPYAEFSNYALLQTLTSVGGVLTISVDRHDTLSQASIATVIGGFQLEETSAVPEPSVIALFGLGLAGLGFARRRRQS